MASLVVIATCETCGASQLQDGRILVAPERALDCKTHTFIKEEVVPQPPQQMSMIGSMPSQKECVANDQLNDHLFVVEENISRTQLTIHTLDERHSHWRSVIADDFQRVVEAAEARRDKLWADLDSLVHAKQDLLSGQLAEYTEHRDNCQNTIDSIFQRIQYDRRDHTRQQGIVQDSKDTINAFPVLTPIPIAIATECQTQPIVFTLDNLGAVLESSLGRLPTILIENVNDARQNIKYHVIDPEDAEEKFNIASIPGLEVEVQASVFGSRSLGWDVAWTTRVPCRNAEGTVSIDTKSLPRGDKVLIRARTIIVDAKDPSDPIRISSWSDVSEMAIQNVGGRRPAAAAARSPSQPSGPPPMFMCVAPALGSRWPCKPTHSDYVGAIKSSAIKKFKWDCSPEDITLKVVEKKGDVVVADLSTEESPSVVLADVWNRAAHFVHVIQQDGAPVVEPSHEPAPGPGPDVNIEWPKRMLLRIKPDASPATKAKPHNLKIEERDGPGGWIGAIQTNYCKKLGLEEGNMRFFFVDEEGTRVKDIETDSDFLYALEIRSKLFVVGERV